MAGVITCLALVASVPLFLRMPPWCDVTLYDVAASNLLRGGLHYRDVFDTNTPGFVWALTALRSVVGPGSEPLMAADLLIVAGIVLLLDRLAARAGANRAARAWAVAAAALYYPFTTEACHAQRDVWMLLPALAAVAVRVSRLVEPAGDPRPRIFARAALEGVLWGTAVWIKPHVVIPAVTVWLTTAPRVFAVGRWRAVAADLLGNIAGGGTVGAAGIGYLIASGTWPYFVDVFTFWNTGYAAQMWSELPQRFDLQLLYFAPWSYLQLLAVPLAILSLVDARPWVLDPRRQSELGPVGRWLPAWLWDGSATDAERYARVAIAAAYLGWTAQAIFLQRQFRYVHVPEILILFALLAAHRWVMVCGVMGWLAVTSLVVLAGWAAEPAPLPGYGSDSPTPDIFLRHPLADPERMSWWPACWRTGLSPVAYRERMAALGQIKEFHAAIEWVELGEIADELRRRGVKDGEVLGWHDAPHAVYGLLGVRPGFRFQHVSHMRGIGPAQEQRLLDEFRAAVPHVRYVVSDLYRAGAVDPDLIGGDFTATSPDLLPPTMSPDLRAEFPWDQPAVFRSAHGRGRYLIHALTRPINLGVEDK
ncbi:hypothetical protein FRUB_02759 [Fimbriiglobus ruber]|uniref:Glycosyltransferase RgtA/B/C/D-like domain-containing protein n=1 Tax=Fimbriiglobus ruber TaxID=1908690 RepID=A0A225DNX2_9BACT|nr:hypothetical protein FRUB_02759 [Fimbriiglobus ruber]